jgi:hypothetical protein
MKIPARVGFTCSRTIYALVEGQMAAKSHKNLAWEIQKFQLFQVFVVTGELKVLTQIAGKTYFHSKRLGEDKKCSLTAP